MVSEMNRAFLQVEVHDWCTAERIKNFKSEYLSYLDVFAVCPQSHDLFIRSWVQINHIKALQANDLKICKLDDVDASTFVQNWSETRDDVFLTLLPRDKINMYATCENLMLKWASCEWSHRLESLYLERKSGLDQISCSLIRVADPFLASEIYHRLRSDNVPFDQLSWQFGEGPERKNSGFFPLIRASQLPDGFMPLIKKLNEGDILKPHRIGKWNVIIQLHKVMQSQFNLETQEFILKTEVDAWTSAVSKVLLSSLE